MGLLFSFVPSLQGLGRCFWWSPMWQSPAAGIPPLMPVGLTYHLCHCAIPPGSSASSLAPLTTASSDPSTGQIWASFFNGQSLFLINFLCPDIFSLTLSQSYWISFSSSDAVLLTFGLGIHSLLCPEYCPLPRCWSHLTVAGCFTISPS